MIFTAPQSEDELLNRAYQIAGATFTQLAALTQQNAPQQLTSAKGWLGQTLERILGATAATLSEPDFQRLGIELKTIPVNPNGQPRESTYVCTVPLLQIAAMPWEASSVYKKLARVLWIPVQGDPKIPVAERRIGYPILWSPTAEQSEALRQDWEELAEWISLGKVEQIHGRLGRYLQIRPKAANARELCTAIGENGCKIQTLPRGFYLRASFTAVILNPHVSVLNQQNP